MPDVADTVFDELERLEEIQPRQRRGWSLWLLFIPLLTVIYPPAYSRVHPELAGVPFFVWYLIAAVIFGGAVTGAVYALRGTERSLR